MEVSQEMYSCARTIRQKGLAVLVIFLLESSKPCVGMLREGIVSSLPFLKVFLGETGLNVLQSFKTSADVELFIGLLETQEVE